MANLVGEVFTDFMSKQYLKYHYGHLLEVDLDAEVELISKKESNLSANDRRKVLALKELLKRKEVMDAEEAQKKEEKSEEPSETV